MTVRVLLTGATGFVGRALFERMNANGAFTVRLAARSDLTGTEWTKDIDLFQVPGIDGETDWGGAFDGVDVVIHAAARVHVLNETASDALAEYRKVNVDGTLNLARQAAAAGVKRFLFVSSVKVNGEGTQPGRPFAADDRCTPEGGYALSKHEAERGLLELSSTTGMEVVIVRPVLVYGPGVKANFLSMMVWLKRGVPLPLGGVRNRRSLIFIENLVDVILLAAGHRAAANQIFLVSDGEDLATPELLRRLGRALGKPARLLPVPASLLELGARLIGRPGMAQRLCGSLEVDISKTRELLGWVPPVTVDDALARTARYFIDHQYTQ